MNFLNRNYLQAGPRLLKKRIICLFVETGSDMKFDFRFKLFQCLQALPGELQLDKDMMQLYVSVIVFTTFD